MKEASGCKKSHLEALMRLQNPWAGSEHSPMKTLSAFRESRSYWQMRRCWHALKADCPLQGERHISGRWMCFLRVHQSCLCFVHKWGWSHWRNPSLGCVPFYKHRGTRERRRRVWYGPGVHSEPTSTENGGRWRSREALKTCLIASTPIHQPWVQPLFLSPPAVNHVAFSKPEKFSP